MTTQPKPEKSPRFLSRREQAARYGTSVKSIVRWGDDPRMQMPKEYVFHRQMKRREDELEVWERSRVEAKSA